MFQNVVEQSLIEHKSRQLTTGIDLPHWNITLCSLYPALLLAKHNLKHLWLDVSQHNIIDRADGAHWPSFSDFTVLKLLLAPIDLLLQYHYSLPNLATILPSPLMGELLIASDDYLTQGDARMDAVEPDTQTPDLTSAAPAIGHAVALFTLCTQRWN
ncbi:hypothetical protein BJY04DRAFT_224376 [Aspergillus karnatakaensis]|uniref:uncharacterized protein n=1 Tax=Aspergillus karnatakaensis TaxID=1810916 RepID=UPI003CCD6B6E